MIDTETSLAELDEDDVVPARVIGDLSKEVNRACTVNRLTGVYSYRLTGYTNMTNHTDLQASVREALSPPWKLTSNTIRKLLSL